MDKNLAILFHPPTPKYKHFSLFLGPQFSANPRNSGAVNIKKKTVKLTNCQSLRVGKFSLFLVVCKLYELNTYKLVKVIF